MGAGAEPSGGYGEDYAELYEEESFEDDMEADEYYGGGDDFFFIQPFKGMSLCEYVLIIL